MRAACVFLLLSALGMGTLATGCSSSSKVEARTTTVGQELEDLEDARDRGLITEDEYQKQRRKILNRK